MSKKEAILKAAIKLFAAKGFERTSVRKIAEKVALSIPVMFHYFPSKEETLNEIMIGFMERVHKGSRRSITAIWAPSWPLGALFEITGGAS